MKDRLLYLTIGALLGIAILTVLVSEPWVRASGWKEVPLENRIKGADLVVVGKLVDVREGLSISYAEDWDGAHPGLEVFYNTGRIIVRDFLQGDRWPSTLTFIFPAGRAKRKKDGADVISAMWDDFEFSEGDTGIWILHHGRIGAFSNIITRPDNYLPIDSLEAVKKHAVLKRGRR